MTWQVFTRCLNSHGTHSITRPTKRLFPQTKNHPSKINENTGQRDRYKAWPHGIMQNRTGFTTINMFPKFLTVRQKQRLILVMS